MMQKLAPLFLSVDKCDAIIDYHSHSNYNDDADGTVEEYAKSAIMKELSSIAITNHVWRTSAWINNFINDVKSVRSKYGYHLLIGFEAKVINIDGEVDICSSCIKETELLLGALHHLPTCDDYTWIDDESLSHRKAAEIIRDATLNMISRNEVDVITHLLALYYQKYNVPFPEDFLEEIVLSASKRSIAIEIYNSKHPLSNEVFKNLIRLCVEYNVPMTVGSDAHNPSEIGNMDYKGIQRAIRST
jgi:putative hydrolase